MDVSPKRNATYVVTILAQCSIQNTTCTQTFGTNSPWRLNFVRWRLLFEFLSTKFLNVTHLLRWLINFWEIFIPYHRPLFHVCCYYRLQHYAHIYVTSKTPTWPPIFLKKSKEAAEKYFEFLFWFINNSWFDQQIVKEYFQDDGIFVPQYHFNLWKFLVRIAVLMEGNEMH